jgi:drug/metabolite transporter (DMT)-like permease
MTTWTDEKKEGWGIIFSIAGILCFSLLEVTSKPFKGLISPLAVTSLRFFTGGIILLIFGFKTSLARGLFQIKNVFKCFLLASLGLNLSMGLLQIAVNHIPAGVAATIISSVPAFVPFFVWLIKKEPPSLKQMLIIISGLIGIALISFEGIQNLNYSITGIVLTLISAALFALYSVLGVDFFKKFGPAGTLGLGAIWTGLSFLPFIYRNLPDPGLIIENWLRIAVLGIIVSGIGYLFYFKGIELLGPSRGASFFFLKPCAAAVLSYKYLNESFTALEITGMLIISAAVLFTGYNPKKTSLSSAAPPEGSS